jgi:hypothetical protein
MPKRKHTVYSNLSKPVPACCDTPGLVVVRNSRPRRPGCIAHPAVDATTPGIVPEMSG